LLQSFAIHAPVVNDLLLPIIEPIQSLFVESDINGTDPPLYSAISRSRALPSWHQVVQVDLALSAKSRRA
jgi:hypothetical protein